MPRRSFKSSLSRPPRSLPFWRNRRYRRIAPARGRRSLAAPLAALVMVAACVGLYLISGKLPLGRELATPAAAAARPVAEARPMPPRPRPAPGPQPLQARLDQIAQNFGEPVGIAVADVEAGWAASVRGDEYFPQQSVSKTWVALAVLDAVDRGLLRIDSPVTMTLADRSVFNQPLGRSLTPEGFTTTIPNLMRHALSFSDNSANDTLIRLIGLDSVRETLVRKGFRGIKMGADERHLQALIAGLTWQPDFSEGRNFEAARAKLDPQARRQALEAYLHDPIDGATPISVVQVSPPFSAASS